MTDLRMVAGTMASFAMVAAQVAPVPAALVPIGAAAAQAQQQTRIVSCYSRGNTQNSCRLPANTVSVSFVGPDRTGRCLEGRTYAQRGNSLWVTGGCGGNFEVVTNAGGGWGGGGGWTPPPGGGGGGNWGDQSFAGEITCRSQNNREQTCRANTQGRVQLLQQYSNARCIEGQTWRADQNSISVRNGCQARFGYGFAGNDGGNWGGGGGWGGNQQGFAGQIECRSQNNRYVRCPANTNNRVELLRQFSSTSCVRGSTWGYDRNSVWVNRGCQARFGYGYGNVTGDASGGGSGGGSNAGGIIAGGLLAAGLIAALAAAGKGDKSGQSSRGPATVEADLTKFPSAARDEGQACMNEAARQIGATGGTRVRLVNVDTAQQSGQGWMILADVSGTWDDHIQAMKMDCRATGSKVTAFDVK